MTGRSRERISDLVRPHVEALGLDLEDVTVTTAGRRRTVRVVVDADGGVDLDAVADATRAVSDALDADDPDGEEPYVLEVTSPGVDRPLTEPRHWRRAQGRLVEITLADDTELRGRPTEVADDGSTVTLTVESVPPKKGMRPKLSERVVALADVRHALVQVEFGSAKAGEVVGAGADDDIDDDFEDDLDDDSFDENEEA
jgi:ribosome maturation factor RimP